MNVGKWQTRCTPPPYANHTTAIRIFLATSSAHPIYDWLSRIESKPRVMNNPAQAPHQTALLIAHTAAWSRTINEATPTSRSDGDSSTGPAVPVANRAPRPQGVRCAEGTAPQ